MMPSLAKPGSVLSLQLVSDVLSATILNLYRNQKNSGSMLSYVETL